MHRQKNDQRKNSLDTISVDNKVIKTSIWIQLGFFSRFVTADFLEFRVV